VVSLISAPSSVSTGFPQKTPLKINLKPKNEGSENDDPFPKSCFAACLAVQFSKVFVSFIFMAPTKKHPAPRHQPSFSQMMIGMSNHL